MQPEYLVNDDGCWIWQKCRNNRGYGLKWDPATRRLMMAHRWYYERARGPIPMGLQARACDDASEHLLAERPAEVSSLPR